MVTDKRRRSTSDDPFINEGNKRRRRSDSMRPQEPEVYILDENRPKPSPRRSSGRGQSKGQRRERAPESARTKSRGTQGNRRSPPAEKQKKRRPPSKEKGYPRERKRRTYKKLNRKVKTVIYLFLFVVVVAAAFLLSAFLLFKVGGIEVRGNTQYSSSQIIEASGVGMEENLLFLSQDSIKEKIIKQLPYIDNVEIKRKIPSTLIIEVEPVDFIVSVQKGSEYVYVCMNERVIEVQPVPYADSLIVYGLVIDVAESGRQIGIAEGEKIEAYREIIDTIVSLDSSSFTRVDLNDINRIDVYYQDRVVMKLGARTDLRYKIEFGYKSLTTEGVNGIAENERGFLDLSLLKEVNRSYFTPEDEENQVLSGLGVWQPDTEGDDEIVKEEDAIGAESGMESGETSETSEGRGEGIPDAPLQ